MLKACALLALALVASQAAAVERSAAAVLAFKRANPCPSTGERRGSCPGFEVDHSRALCLGGADTPANMQWLEISVHRAKTREDVRACRALRRAEAP